MDGKICAPIFREKNLREKNFKLTRDQKIAVKKIEKSRRPILLFGVTGSGKTEIYKNLAEKCRGQILFLCPEISLTPQLIDEFRNIFADDEIAIWHSNLSAGEKVQNFARLQNGDAKILIGTRSAALVPLPRPQLIILDEEHEWTFKNEFAPRFWTHDVAEKISAKFSAKLIFGSATPRAETFARAEK